MEQMYISGKDVVKKLRIKNRIEYYGKNLCRNRKRKFICRVDHEQEKNQLASA